MAEDKQRQNEDKNLMHHCTWNDTQMMVPNIRRHTRARVAYTNDQHLRLEKEFQLHRGDNSRPNRGKLAAELGLSEVQVRSWFQNRRLKQKIIDARAKEESERQRMTLGLSGWSPYSSPYSFPAVNVAQMLLPAPPAFQDGPMPVHAESGKDQILDNLTMANDKSTSKPNDHSKSNSEQQQKEENTIPVHYCITYGGSINKTMDPNIHDCRRAYTRDQIIRLEKEFRSANDDSVSRRCKLAAELGLTEKRIKVWFKNRRIMEKYRRIKEKRQRQEEMHHRRMQARMQHMHRHMEEKLHYRALSRSCPTYNVHKADPAIDAVQTAQLPSLTHHVGSAGLRRDNRTKLVARVLPRQYDDNTRHRELATRRNYDYVIIDVPNQIEVLRWLDSGSIITEALSYNFPKILCYLVIAMLTYLLYFTLFFHHN